MRWGVAESMCDLSHYVPLAKVADELGFHSFALGDSIIYPEVAVGKYPYNADGDRTFLENAPMPDPFQIIAAMATVTERIRFKVGVLKLPIRRPVLVAKQTASLACITGNPLHPGRRTLALARGLPGHRRGLEDPRRPHGGDDRDPPRPAGRGLLRVITASSTTSRVSS